MSMSNAGLTKLIEECSEVIQVAAKAIALGGVGDHWDGSNLKYRLESEIGDLSAAIEFVVRAHDLSEVKITEQHCSKISLFRRWDKE